MWPWEHIAFAYVSASAVSRLLWGRPPSDRAVAAIVFAALLPDLVDKPLAWGLDVLPSGRSLAHSLLVALPLLLTVLAVGTRRNETQTAVAFGVAYLSHLAGDVIYPALTEGVLRTAFLLWPLVPAEPTGTKDVGHILDLFVEYGAFLVSPRGFAYLSLELVALTLTVLLWAVDGTPGRWWSRSDGRDQ